MTGSVSKLISESDFGFTARLLRMVHFTINCGVALDTPQEL